MVCILDIFIVVCFVAVCILVIQLFVCIGVFNKFCRLHNLDLWPLWLEVGRYCVSRSVCQFSVGPMWQIDMETEVSEELGEIIVDKETARASYVLLSSYIFLLCIYLLVLAFENWRKSGDLWRTDEARPLSGGQSFYVSFSAFTLLVGWQERHIWLIWNLYHLIPKVFFWNKWRMKTKLTQVHVENSGGR